jgi:hypothetical protein
LLAAPALLASATAAKRHARADAAEQAATLIFFFLATPLARAAGLATTLASTLLAALVLWFSGKRVESRQG